MESTYILPLIIGIVVIFYFFDLTKKSKAEAFDDIIQTKLRSQNRHFISSRLPNGDDWDEGPYEKYRIGIFISSGALNSETHYRIIRFEEDGITKKAWAKIKVNFFTGQRVEISGIKNVWPH